MRGKTVSRKRKVLRRTVPAKSPVQIVADNIKHILSQSDRVDLLLQGKMDSGYLKAYNFSCAVLRRTYKVSIQEAMKLGFKLPSLLEAGYNAREFRSAGYSAEKILNEIIFTWNDHISNFDLERMGFSKQEIRKAIKRLS